MEKNRLEAFSDGVLAIIITIMVLELKVPHGVDFAALEPVLPVFLSYVLSFLYVGIYWNNHHHLFQTTEARTRRHSMGESSPAVLAIAVSVFDGVDGRNHLAPVPAAFYGFVLLMAAIAYYLLQHAIITDQGPNSLLASAVGRDWKGKLSPVVYVAAIALAFVSPWIASGLYTFVALLWLVPDRRIERALEKRGE